MQGQAKGSKVELRAGPGQRRLSPSSVLWSMRKSRFVPRKFLKCDLQSYRFCCILTAVESLVELSVFGERYVGNFSSVLCISEDGPGGK